MGRNTSNTAKEAPSLLLLVDDKPDNLDILIHHLGDAGYDLAVALSGEEALKLAKEQVPSLILLDVMMPGIDGFETCTLLKLSPATRDIPVIFMSALSDTDSKVKGFNAGGVDFVTKPLQREEILARINAHLTIQQQRHLLQTQNKSLENLNNELKNQINRREVVEQALSVADKKLSALTDKEARQWGIDSFIGHSPLVTAVLEEVRSLQQVDKTNVLILGESGTGKELISRAIHFGSSRKDQPFVAVNCSAIPSELADAEFFGHSKGAFTGAINDRSGYFSQADNGTLFLDEIGDMPLTLQAKLLRVLEDGKVSPVGSNTINKVNVRIVAATNVDLRGKVKAKTFRQDLYYRLSGYVITLPALRERINDIPYLTDHFLTQLAQQMGREKSAITEQAMHVLQSYHFSGNVRELKNLIEHALISSRGGTIDIQHIRFINENSQPLNNQSLSTQNIVSTLQARNSDEDIILAYLKEYGRIDNSIAQEILNIEHGRASYLLKKLLSEEQIKKQGQRRWAYYILG